MEGLTTVSVNITITGPTADQLPSANNAILVLGAAGDFVVS